MGKLLQKEDAIFGWADTILNPVTDPPTPKIPIIWMAGNGPLPDASYVQLNITSDRRIGSVDKNEFNQTTGVITQRSQWELVVSIQGNGAKGADYLQKLYDSLDDEDDVLGTNGFAVRDEGVIQHIPELLDETAEKRWVMELTLGYTWLVEDNVGWIETVEWTYEV